MMTLSRVYLHCYFDCPHKQKQHGIYYRECSCYNVPSTESFYDIRKKEIPFFNCRTNCFKYSFFPNPLSGWSQLTKPGVYCSFQKKTSLLQNLAKDLHLMLMNLKVLNT